MSEISQKRQQVRGTRVFYAYWLEPKRRFYAVLIVFLSFGFLEHISRWFFIGACAAVLIHLLLALRLGNIYVRTISLKSRDVVYGKNDPPFRVAIAIHFLILAFVTFAIFLHT